MLAEVQFKNYRIKYNDLHDIAAIIECYILDVYKSRNIRKGDTLIDIGAGVGEFAVLASKLVGNNGKVIAIEPSPDDFNTLLMNLKNNFCNNVIPLNMAISDKREKIKLQFKGKTFESNADSLANILRNLDTGYRKIRFMKMDIEGGERLAIPSSLEIIENLDFLAIEIHGGYANELYYLCLIVAHYVNLISVNLLFLRLFLITPSNSLIVTFFPLSTLHKLVYRMLFLCFSNRFLYI